MDYTKLPLHNDNCNEKTKESSPVSSASPVRPVSINFAHVAMYPIVYFYEFHSFIPI